MREESKKTGRLLFPLAEVGYSGCFLGWVVPDNLNRRPPTLPFLIHTPLLQLWRRVTSSATHSLSARFVLPEDPTDISRSSTSRLSYEHSLSSERPMSSIQNRVPSCFVQETRAETGCTNDSASCQEIRRLKSSSGPWIRRPVSTEGAVRSRRWTSVNGSVASGVLLREYAVTS